MTDKQLLVLAARAAGIDGLKFRGSPQHKAEWVYDVKNAYEFTPWNPIEDDGDALRLAVTRNIFRCHMDLFHKFYEEEILNGLDNGSATRRAIVRAAAEVGKGMLTQDEFMAMFPGQFVENEK